MDTDGGNVRTLVATGATCYMPSWQVTPAGERIVFGMHGAKPEMASVAPDGIVEAFVDPKKRFFVGVQWHPEAMRDGERHDRIYARLVAAAARRG